jgi:predicted homoserine dehydrogenase-like protein
LAQGIALNKSIKAGNAIGWDDVKFNATDDAIAFRKSMECLFSAKDK